MKQEELTQMFNNRWRIKREANADVFDEIGSTCETLIRSICRDFFEAGIYLSIGTEERIPQVEAVSKRLEMVYDNISESGFEEWWSLYQKKVDRKKCIKKWKKLSPMEQYKCIQATPAYVASTPDPTYRKNPLTYLNGECWNDEIIIRQDGNKPPKQDPASRLADILVG